MTALAQSGHGDRVLLMTLGTGDPARREESLFAPVRKSIAKGEWKFVTLLPSTVTEELAQELSSIVRGVDVRVHPLPMGAEDDADKAYSHFDERLVEILGVTRPENVEIDFTRGTKAMSAALVLAAARHEIPSLRYVTGERDSRGTVVPGTEQVRHVRTTTVEVHRRLDLSRDLMCRGNFTACAEVLDGLPSSGDLPKQVSIFREIQAAARYYAAWDRLDYSSAAQIELGSQPSERWAALWPTERSREWVATLACMPDRSNHKEMAEWLRCLLVDLLANGERRVQQGDYEDALVRAYRVLELVGQARLFDHGLDSGNLDSDHESVKRLREELRQKGEHPLKEGQDGQIQAARLQSARLLRQCNDPIAERLMQFEKETLLKPSLRNTSVLVHGFTSRAPADESQLCGLFESLERLIEADGGGSVRSKLAVARLLSFHDC